MSTPTQEQTLLHVGCGPKRQNRTTRGFNQPSWREIRLDIDPAVAPDLIGSMTDMGAVATGTVAAIFSSHNLEHLYPHEVPLALQEFRRVLQPTGFAVITCPDLQAVAALIADNRLTETAYTSPAGPITALDMLYGHQAALARGQLFMAHRCGFTKSSLTQLLRQHGFATTISRRRGHPYYDLWLLASCAPRTAEAIRALAADHFPNG